MITNINYIGRISSVEQLTFRSKSPQMCIKKCKNFTMIIFKSGKCRLMGCKTPILTRVINVDDDGLSVTILRIQSASAVYNFGGNGFILNILGNYCHYNGIPYLFEPELFPALRLTSFSPLCINLFASGKCTILGMRHLFYKQYVKQVVQLINISGCEYAATAEKVDIRKDGFTTIQRNPAETQGLFDFEGRGSTATTTTTTTTQTTRKRCEEATTTTNIKEEEASHAKKKVEEEEGEEDDA